MLEHRAVAVPADSSAGIEAGHQDLNEVGRGQAGKACNPVAQSEQVVGARLRRPEARVLEVVIRAERRRLPLALPPLEAEPAAMR
jgi:hypothetical protein